MNTTTSATCFLPSDRTVNPLLFTICNITIDFNAIDLLRLHFQILTKDSVTISVDAVVYYRVQNATMSIANVENADGATRLLSQTTLRNMLGTKSLSEVLTDREYISAGMQVGCLRSNLPGPHIYPAHHLSLNSRWLEKLDRKCKRSQIFAFVSHLLIVAGSLFLIRHVLI